MKRGTLLVDRDAPDVVGWFLYFIPAHGPWKYDRITIRPLGHPPWATLTAPSSDFVPVQLAFWSIW